MREHGYRVYQATEAVYVLSVSAEQNTVPKLVRHAWLFGTIHPLLVLGDPATRAGVTGGAAGPNRRERAALRGWQVVSVVAYAGAMAAPLLDLPWTSVGLAVAGVFAGKLWLFRRHLRHIPFSAWELVKLLALQVPMDVAYVAGLGRGLWLVARGRRRGRVPS
jgi:transposase